MAAVCWFEVCRISELPAKGNGFSCFSLVRKEPKVHQRFANLWTPGTIQSSAGSDFAEISGGSCRNRFCLQNGGKKALNRCDIPALQRKDLERTLKGQRCSLADSRLWLGRNGRCLWRKRVALDSDKKRFWKKKGFWLAEISSFQVQLEKFSAKGNVFDRRKRPTFQLMHDQPIKKSLFSAQQNSNFPPHPN